MHKNKSKIFTLTKESLLSQIGVALSDYFIATFSQEEGNLQLRFPNGQRFTLTIQ